MKKATLLLLCLVLIGVVLADEIPARLRAQQFIVMGYQGLLNDLEVGKGPYWRTLTDLLAIPADEQPKALDQIRALAKKYPNIMDFADQVLLINSKAAPAAPVVVPPLASPIPSGPKIFSGDALPNALEHLTRGMTVTVFPVTGPSVSGRVDDYNARRLWIRTPAPKSFKIDEIRAVQAPEL